MCIKFDQIDGFIKIYVRIQYLVLFGSGFDKICDMIKYLISEKGVTDSINHNFGRIRIFSYNFLRIEEILTFHNAIILSKSVVDNKNEYNYNIFLEKALYKDKDNTQYL